MQHAVNDAVCAKALAGLSSVEHIDLTGCFRLTDIGIISMVHGGYLKKLREVAVPPIY